MRAAAIDADAAGARARVTLAMLNSKRLLHDRLPSLKDKHGGMSQV